MVEDQGRDVAGMGVAEADKATTPGGFVDNGLEDPEVLCWTAEPKDGLRVNAGTMGFVGDSEQVGVRDVLRRLHRVGHHSESFSGNYFLRVHHFYLTV